MIQRLALHPDRLFPSDPDTRAIARRLYGEVANLPIVSPHGHTDPEWWATDANFSNAAELLLHPDHYVFRMLYSQGTSLESLGIGKQMLTRAKAGGCLPNVISCFAARRRACGWIGCLLKASELMFCSPPRPLIATTIR